MLLTIGRDHRKVSQVNTTENSTRTHANSLASEPGVHELQNVTLFSAGLADDSRLRSRVHKCLHRVAVDLGVNVKHGDLAKELRAVLECSLVIGLNETLANLFLNLLLSFDIVRIRIL